MMKRTPTKKKKKRKKKTDGLSPELLAQALGALMKLTIASGTQTLRFWKCSSPDVSESSCLAFTEQLAALRTFWLAHQCSFRMEGNCDESCLWRKAAGLWRATSKAFSPYLQGQQPLKLYDLWPAGDCLVCSRGFQWLWDIYATNPVS